jgi:hypothetical protein
VTALDDLYWRAEILQALYWMDGEGLASEVTAARLAEFLMADESTMGRQLAQLTTNGYLEVLEGAAYRLTTLGRTEGARSFQDEFADYIKPAHAECGPACWCKDPNHAGEPCPSTLPVPPAPAPEPTPEAPRGR